MKKVGVILLTACLVSSVSLAQDEVVKVCDVTIEFHGQTKHYIMTVLSNGTNQLSGKIEILKEGTIKYEKVLKTTNSVRNDLSAEIMMSDEFDKLNKGERFIVHALRVESLMMFSGVELTRVRSIDVYEFMEEGVNIGTTAFAEARDGNGKVMGSFMGGFFVAPCN